MVLKRYMCAAVLIILPALVLSNYGHRSKRSDDFIPCEEGWFLYKDKCLKISGKTRDDRASWHTARETCARNGGTMNSIHSEEEKDFVQIFLISSSRFQTWIGLHDVNNEGQFEWDDGSAVDYTNWREGAPSPGSYGEHEDCTEMNFTPEDNHVGVWNDLGCGEPLMYICQKKTSNAKSSRNPQYCLPEEGGGWKYQSSCYHIIMERKSWTQAEEHCKVNFNGHLVKILDTTIDVYLKHQLKNLNRGFWIGIQLKEEFQQQWSSGWYVSYDGILEHIDNSIFRDDTCVLISAQGQYEIVPCSGRNSFICEVTEDRPPVLKPPPKGSHCPHDIYSKWRDLGGEYCYFFERKRHVEWYIANFDCLSKGGNLVSIHSQEETETLRHFIQYAQKAAFIGLFRNSSKEPDFIWSDGSPVDYQFWGPNEPNRVEEKCVLLWLRTHQWTNGMSWWDFDCSDRNGYICSVKKVMPQFTTTKSQNDCIGSTTAFTEGNECSVSSNSTTNSEMIKQADSLYIGVISVCAALVIILGGMVIYCHRSRRRERKMTSNAVSMAVCMAKDASADDPARCSSQYTQPFPYDTTYEPMF